METKVSKKKSDTEKRLTLVISRSMSIRDVEDFWGKKNVKVVHEKLIPLMPHKPEE